MREPEVIKKEKNKKRAISVMDIALIGMMIAIIEVSKRSLDFLPNVELVTFWIIMFTLFLGGKAIYGVLGFVVIEGMIFGFHIWWIMYLYLWPALVLITWLFRKNESMFLWAVISGIFGLLFGAAGSLPYLFIGTAGGGLANGFYTAFSWWIAGIPWDLTHGIANFVVMIVLYHPIRYVMKKMKYQVY